MPSPMWTATARSPRPGPPPRARRPVPASARWTGSPCRSRTISSWPECPPDGAACCSAIMCPTATMSAWTASRCWRRHHRQDHHAGIRIDGPHPEPLVGRNPQSLGSQPDTRRLFGRRRRLGRCRGHAARDRHRYGRQHAPPGFLYRPCGIAAFNRAAASPVRLSPTALDFQAICPFARTVRDMLLLSCALAGPDPRDPFSSDFRLRRMSRPTISFVSAGSPRSAARVRRRRSRRRSVPPSTA